VGESFERGFGFGGREGVVGRQVHRGAPCPGGTTAEERAPPIRRAGSASGGSTARFARSHATNGAHARARSVVRLLGETHAIDRRKIVGDGFPAVALVLADPEVPRGTAEREVLAAVVERVAVDHVVGVLLRQPVAELLPGGPAVSGARDEKAAVDGRAMRVGLAGDEPRGLAVALVGRDGEAEVHASLGVADLLPGDGSVVAVEHAAVVLLPDMVGIALAQRD